MENKIKPSEIIEALSYKIASQYGMDPVNVNILIAGWLLDNNYEIKHVSILEFKK